MATTRKRTTRKPVRKNTARKPVRKNTARKPVRKNTARKPVRKNTAKKPVRNAAKRKVALTWGKDVKGHPISGRPCAGRVMSQRDAKLFTKMGKRRAGVTLKTIKDAYGTDYDKLAKAKKTRKPAAKKAAPKRKAPAKRKTTAKRRAPAKKKAAGRKPALPRKGAAVAVSGMPASGRTQKYVVVHVAGASRYRFQSSHKLLTTARKKEAALRAANPKKQFAIVKMDHG